MSTISQAEDWARAHAARGCPIMGGLALYSYANRVACRYISLLAHTKSGSQGINFALFPPPPPPLSPTPIAHQLPSISINNVITSPPSRASPNHSHSWVKGLTQIVIPNFYSLGVSVIYVKSLKVWSINIDDDDNDDCVFFNRKTIHLCFFLIACLFAASFLHLHIY